MRFSIRVLLNYRGYRSRPSLSTCQSIDSKSILTNRNSGFFKLSLVLAKQLPIIITSERQRDSPLVYVYMYSWEIQTFFEFKTVSMRCWLADHHPRYAMFYVPGNAHGSPFLSFTDLWSPCYGTNLNVTLCFNTFTFPLKGQRILLIQNLYLTLASKKATNVNFNVKCFALSIEQHFALWVNCLKEYVTSLHWKTGFLVTYLFKTRTFF